MNAPYWIHCNICAARLGNDKRIFFLNCSHLLCLSCMKHSDRGTKCPLCKKAIEYKEMNQLPDRMKLFFMPNVTNTLLDPLKMIDFQRKQQENIVKLTIGFQSKVKKTVQMKAQLEDEIKKIKADLERLVGQRKLMQQKLKAVYVKKQQKRVDYRSPGNITMPSSFSSLSTSTPLQSTSGLSRSGPNFSTSSIGSSGGFFNEDASMLQSHKEMKRSSQSSVWIETTNGSKHYQSSRKPPFT